MIFRREKYMKRLTAGLGMSKAELFAKVQETHPEKEFNEVHVVADEETRYVAIATYKVDYFYRGHPPCLVFAVYKDDSRVEEIASRGYGLGIK